MLSIPGGGAMKLKAAEGSDRLFYYGADFAGDLLFHYDLKNNNLGFAVGVQYTSNGLGYNYVTNAELNGNTDIINIKKYKLTEKQRISSLAFPVILKFGHNIYTKMSYFFIGAQYNMNMKLKQKQEVSWTNDFIISGDKKKLKKNNIMYFAGYNYSIFNIEVGFMPDTFFDTSYTISEENIEYKPLSNQKKNIFYFKTSIHIPLSEWTMSKSWRLEKIRRKFKRL